MSTQSIDVNNAGVDDHLKWEEPDIIPFEGCPAYLRRMGENVISDNSDFDTVLTKKLGVER